MSVTPLPGRETQSAALIERLGLLPHPEGGFYREFHRSRSLVRDPGLGERPASTIIHYLLRDGEWSAWHRIRTEEIWIHAGGAPLVLEWASLDFRSTGRVRLGPPGHPDAATFHSVPPNVWQAARPESPFSLAICVVAPGFSFEDLEFLAPSHPALAAIPESARSRIAPLLRR